jgi:DNA-binding ferritin-like protein
MEKVHQLANLYVATLRAIYLVEQHCHWTSKGDTFYGNHLLLERLYKNLVDESDQAAEKMIGLFGKKGVDYKEQCALIHKIVEKYADLAEDPIKQALAIEKDFLKLSDTLFNEFEKMGVLSIGLDDLIMAIASKHEEHTYLLGQVLANK